jgi:hypothetical protein
LLTRYVRVPLRSADFIVEKWKGRLDNRRGAMRRLT